MHNPGQTKKSGQKILPALSWAWRMARAVVYSGYLPELEVLDDCD
jgi:hypothetical protein